MEPPEPALLALCETLRARAHPDADRIIAAAISYDHACREEFAQQHDHFKLVGQDNFRRYLSLDNLRIRVHPDDTPFDLFARACAAYVVGSRATVSSTRGLVSPAVSLLEELTEPWAGALEFVEETDEQLAKAMRDHETDRVRYAATDRVPLLVLQAAAETGFALLAPRSPLKAGWSCSGICASKASASTIIATAISAPAPLNPAPQCSDTSNFGLHSAFPSSPGLASKMASILACSSSSVFCLSILLSPSSGPSFLRRSV